MKIGRLLIRLVVGGLFIGHGSQKLFGWFGGPGPDGTEQMMYKIDMHPARRQALAAGLTETAGGALLAAGLATPLAAASLTGVMLTAIRKVHAENGVWNTKGGYEYNLVLIALLFALTDDGPGAVSLDALWGHRRWGTRWALAELAAGALGSALAVAIGERVGPPAAPEAQAGPDDAGEPRPREDGKLTAQPL